MASRPETVVRSRILTMAQERTAEAVRIRDGGIVDVGPRRRADHGDADVLDFGDRVVMPAFVDPHAHLEITSRALGLMVDCRVPRCRSIPDVLDALRDGIADAKDGSGWLTAQANLFFNQKLAERRYPSREELVDRFSGRAQGHMGGAVVERGADGHPTDVVSEIDGLLPILPPSRDERRKEHAVRPGSRGKINLHRRQLSAMIRRAAGAGMQLAVHANGGRAQDAVCAAAIMAAPAEAEALPTRVEHAGNLLTEPGAVGRWRRAGVVPVPQPVFLYNFGDFFPVYLGPTAAQGRFPFRMLLDQGFRIPGSSDVYLGAEERQTNLFFGIWCCRKRETFLDEIIEPEQRITIDDALRMHTLHVAETLGLDGVHGSIQKGKAADLVVLDRDPTTVSDDRLLDIQVDHVLVDGRIAWSRPGASAPAAR